MAREGRKEEHQAQPRAVVLRRSYWAYRQLDLFAGQPAPRLDSQNPYARHLQRMRDMRAQEQRS